MNKSAGLDHLSWYTYKNSSRQYIASINANGKVHIPLISISILSHLFQNTNIYKKILECTLIQPGLFINYLTTPHPSAPHLHQMEIPISFSNRRALILKGGEDDMMTLTTVQDLAQIVARIVEYKGEWPVRGGIVGTTMTIREIIRMGERIRV